jgi:hypothetical protein
MKNFQALTVLRPPSLRVNAIAPVAAAQAHLDDVEFLFAGKPDPSLIYDQSDNSRDP